MSRYTARYSEQKLSDLFPVLMGWGAGTGHGMYPTGPGSRCRAICGRRKSGEMYSQMHFISPWAQQKHDLQQPDGLQSGSVT